MEIKEKCEHIEHEVNWAGDCYCCTKCGQVFVYSTNDTALTISFDVRDGDDKAIFYSRMFGEKRVVIIPKNIFLLDDTDSTYVLTLKED